MAEKRTYLTNRAFALFQAESILKLINKKADSPRKGTKGQNKEIVGFYAAAFSTLILGGYSLNKACEVLEIPKQTIVTWRNTKPEFNNIITAAIAMSDLDLPLQTFKQMALGTVKTVDIRTIRENGKEIREETTVKQLPPNMNALTKWLERGTLLDKKDDRESDININLTIDADQKG